MATFGRSDGPGVASGFLGSIMVGIGVALAGWFIAGGLIIMAPPNARVATMSGVAEREVVADLAVWSFTLVAAGPDLPLLQEELNAQTDATRAFLTVQGLDEAEIVFGTLEIINGFDDEPAAAPPAVRNYVLRQPVSVRSSNVESVADASRQAFELLRDSAVIAADADGPYYLFTGAEALRQDLVSEALADARASGERFSLEFETRLGPIAATRTGALQIAPRDPVPNEEVWSQILQRVRVEAEITYQLED